MIKISLDTPAKDICLGKGYTRRMLQNALDYRLNLQRYWHKDGWLDSNPYVLRDYLRPTRTQLLRKPNISKGSVEAFEKYLSQYGLRIGMTDDEILEYELKNHGMTPDEYLQKFKDEELVDEFEEEVIYKWITKGKITFEEFKKWLRSVEEAKEHNEAMDEYWNRGRNDG